MGMCGCYPSCSCGVEAGNDLITVTGSGDVTDPYLVSGVETPLSIEALNAGIGVTPAGPYGHTPGIALRVEDSPTIALGIGPGGLSASLLAAPGDMGGVPTGTPLPWLTNVAPAGFLMLSGPNKAGYVNIADEPALFAVLDHNLSGGVDPGDGTFYVGLPDDHFLITQGSLGPLFTTGGSDTIADQNLPPHDHPITDPGHDHGGVTGDDGAHAHSPATAGRNFVTVEMAGSVPASWANDAPDDLTALFRGSDMSQQNNGSTTTEPAHNHDISSDTTGITGTGDNSTTNDPFLPPFIVVNYMVKT